MFREIRRKNREISIDSAKQLLQSSRRGVLAVNGDDGYPYAIPINYLYDDEAQRIYFHGAKIGHKVDALRASDKVCFTVYGNETIRTDAWAPFMQSVVVFGRCHLIEAGPEATRRIKQLAMKYYPSEQLVDEEIAQSGKAVQVFEIEIEHMRSTRALILVHACHLSRATILLSLNDNNVIHGRTNCIHGGKHP